MLSLVIILFLAFMAYWWAGQGFFSALLHLLVTLVAGALAFALWEPLTVGFLLYRMPAYAWGVGLLAPFILLLIGLRVAMDNLVPANVQCKTIVNYICGGTCGVLAGIICSGMVLLGIGFLPLSADIMGYQPYVLQANGQVVPNPDSSLWPPVDRYTASLYRGLSGGAFYSGQPMAVKTPELASLAAIHRMRIDNNASTSASPAAVKVNGLYAIPTPPIQVPGDVNRMLPPSINEIGQQLVVVDLGFSLVAGTYDSDRTLRLDPQHIRLITSKSVLGEDVVTMHPPLAFSHPPNTLVSEPDGRQITLFNSDRVQAHGTTQQDNLGFVFVIPSDQTIRSIMVRRLRLKLPEPQADPLQLVQMLGTPPMETALGLDPEDPTGQPGAVEGPTAGAQAVKVDVTDALPMWISKNVATAFDYDGDAILSGQSEVRPVVGGFVSNATKANRIKVPGHQVCVRVQISAQKAQSLFGAARASAAQVQGIYLQDDSGEKWFPVAYVVHSTNNIQRIMVGSSPIQSAKELPIADMSSSQQLYLYFPIKRGIKITAVHISESTRQPLELLLQ